MCWTLFWVLGMQQQTKHKKGYISIQVGGDNKQVKHIVYEMKQKTQDRNRRQQESTTLSRSFAMKRRGKWSGNWRGTQDQDSLLKLEEATACLYVQEDDPIERSIDDWKEGRCGRARRFSLSLCVGEKRWEVVLMEVVALAGHFIHRGSATKWALMQAGLWKLSSQCFNFFSETGSKAVLEV